MIAEALGTPLMPWQRYVVDVAFEVDPATSRLAYREVIVSVPRQSGKTTLILPAAVHRAVGFGTAQNIIYTAQTRNDARQKWEDEQIPVLEASPFASQVRARRRTGAEAFLWANGSIHGIPAPTEKGGHGKTLDLAVIDEAFAQKDDRLEQAFGPAMITRPQPQLWVVSTAGTASSTYLRSKVDAGRRRLESGEPTQVAYFEWSAGDDDDPEDPETWRACMPALGHTITEAAIRATLDKFLAEAGPEGLGLFRRAYLNQWPDAHGGDWRVIPHAAWVVRGGAVGRPTEPVAFALDGSWPDAAFGAIGVAGGRGGEMLVQVVEHRPGTGWMVRRAVELAARHPGAVFVLDKKGPAGHLLTDLEAAGLEVVTPAMEDVARAFGRFCAAVTGDEPTLRHYDQPELREALRAAGKRPLGDAFTWARQGETDISPLTAVTLAWHGITTVSTPRVPSFEFVDLWGDR